MGFLRLVSLPVGGMRRKRLTSSAAAESATAVEHVMHFFASVPMGAMRRKWLTCVCDDDCSAHCSLLEAYKMTNHPFGYFVRAASSHGRVNEARQGLWYNRGEWGRE